MFPKAARLAFQKRVRTRITMSRGKPFENLCIAALAFVFLGKNGESAVTVRQSLFYLSRGKCVSVRFFEVGVER